MVELGGLRGPDGMGELEKEAKHAAPRLGWLGIGTGGYIFI